MYTHASTVYLVPLSTAADTAFHYIHCMHSFAVIRKVANHNVDSQNVDSHNVEVTMSKSQNVDSENVDSHNVESVTHTRFRTPGPIGVRNICHACYLSDVLVHRKLTCVFSILYLMRRGNRRGALFLPTTWNVHDRVINDLPHTNNSVEGWHHAF